MDSNRSKTLKALRPTNQSVAKDQLTQVLDGFDGTHHLFKSKKSILNFNIPLNISHIHCTFLRT